MKKILALALALSMSLSLASCAAKTETPGTTTPDTSNPSTSTPEPAKTYELKISTTQTETSMIYGGLKEAADRIMEETDGNVKVTVYAAGALGVEEDMIDQALSGMGIAVLTDAGRMSSYVKDIGVFNMAYLVTNHADGMKIMATDTFQGWLDELVTDHGIRTLTFNYYDGARSFMGNKPATVPADLNGQVTRTIGADPWNESIGAMGATPYNMAWGEVYNSIQTKAIDGCEVQYTSAVSSKIYEVCDYVNKTEHTQLFNCLIAGEKWFSTLPADYQEIVLNVFDEVAAANALEIDAAQAEMEQALIDNGMEIVEVDKDAFVASVAPAYEKLGWTDLREQLCAEAGLN